MLGDLPWDRSSYSEVMLQTPGSLSRAACSRRTSTIRSPHRLFRITRRPAGRRLLRSQSRRRAASTRENPGDPLGPRLPRVRPTELGAWRRRWLREPRCRPHRWPLRLYLSFVRLSDRDLLLSYSDDGAIAGRGRRPSWTKPFPRSAPTPLWRLPRTGSWVCFGPAGGRGSRRAAPRSCARTRWIEVCPCLRVVRFPVPFSCPGAPGGNSFRVDEPDGRAVSERFWAGDDYHGVTPRAGRGFQAIWADARSGVFQVWTRTITPGGDRTWPPARRVRGPISTTFQVPGAASQSPHLRWTLVHPLTRIGDTAFIDRGPLSPRSVPVGREAHLPDASSLRFRRTRRARSSSGC